MVCIKIDRVNKTSPLHPIILLGNVEFDGEYAHVVAKFGNMRTLIFHTSLNACRANDVQFDYTTEVSFSSACKKANDSQ